MPDNSGTDNIFENDLEIASDKKLDKPKMYKVILHNDHYTTMEFVVEILRTVFHLQAIQATKIMLDVHKKGTGLCGVYTYDIAVTKVNQVHQMAKAREFPLKCSYEDA